MHQKHTPLEKLQEKRLCASTATKLGITNANVYTGRRACVGIGREENAKKSCFVLLHTVKVIDERHPFRAFFLMAYF